MNNTKSFEAYNGDIVTIGTDVCFIISARTGSSTVRNIRAKGRVLSMTAAKVKIKVADSECISSVKIGDEVSAWKENIICAYIAEEAPSVNHRFIYCCCGSTILLGNSEFNVSVYNNYGDGEHQVTICDEDHFDAFFQLGKDWFHNNYEAVCSVSGNAINIYKCDTDDTSDPRNILTTISGAYNVYVTKGAFDGDIAIIKSNNLS
jgi:hypothetical protein